MNRYALIVGNPDREGGDGDLKGVVKDIQNYRDYLSSSLGGRR